jgi:hypothetical protein
VPAGSTIHYVSTQQVNHPGPTQYYLAKAPEGKDVKSWDGSGAVWFKISTTMPSVNSQKQMSWPGQSRSHLFPPSDYLYPPHPGFHHPLPTSNPLIQQHDQRFELTGVRLDEYTTPNTTIPSATPSGDYLLRVEHIALHMASQANKAQFYLACSQIKVSGGGNGSPGPLVAFPGAYKSTDPGILVDLNKYTTNPEGYQPPGPAVWRG